MATRPAERARDAVVAATARLDEREDTEGIMLPEDASDGEPRTRPTGDGERRPEE
jgi:hypothetical protein